MSSESTCPSDGPCQGRFGGKARWRRRHSALIAVPPTGCSSDGPAGRCQATICRGLTTSLRSNGPSPEHASRQWSSRTALLTMDRLPGSRGSPTGVTRIPCPRTWTTRTTHDRHPAGSRRRCRAVVESVGLVHGRRGSDTATPLVGAVHGGRHGASARVFRATLLMYGVRPSVGRILGGLSSPGPELGRPCGGLPAADPSEPAEVPAAEVPAAEVPAAEVTAAEVPAAEPPPKSPPPKSPLAISPPPMSPAPRSVSDPMPGSPPHSPPLDMPPPKSPASVPVASPPSAMPVPASEPPSAAPSS